jgi:hypothetical protein
MRKSLGRRQPPPDFGHAGTPLIAAAPTAALDLPLKVLIWEVADGTVWVGYNTPAYLGERHGVSGELLANIRVVESLTARLPAADAHVVRQQRPY